MINSARETVRIKVGIDFFEIGVDYTLTCWIRNYMVEEFTNLRLRFLETSYERESVAEIAELPSHDPESDGLEVKICVNVKPNSTLENISEEFELVLEDDDRNVIIATQRFPRSLQLFSCKTFSTFIPPREFMARNYNILIFGPHGSCKTSMMNSFFTLLNNYREICQLGNVINTRQIRRRHCSTTTNIRRFEVPKAGSSRFADHVEDYHFVFTKFFNLDDEFEYPYCDMKNQNNSKKYLDFMDGRFQTTKLKLEEEENEEEEKEEEEDEENHEKNIIERERRKQRESKMIEERKIHASIFCIPYDTIEILCSKETSSLKTFFNDIYEKFGYFPTIVISQVDDNIDGFRINPLLPETEEMKETRINLARHLGIINLNNIFFGINYIKENRVNFRIDLTNFRILHHVLKTAEVNVRRLSRLYDGKEGELFIRDLKDRLEFLFGGNGNGNYGDQSDYGFFGNRNNDAPEYLYYENGKKNGGVDDDDEPEKLISDIRLMCFGKEVKRFRNVFKSLFF